MHDSRSDLGQAQPGRTQKEETKHKIPTDLQKIYTYILFEYNIKVRYSYTYSFTIYQSINLLSSVHP